MKYNDNYFRHWDALDERIAVLGGKPPRCIRCIAAFFKPFLGPKADLNGSESWEAPLAWSSAGIRDRPWDFHHLYVDVSHHRLSAELFVGLLRILQAIVI